MRVQVLTPRKFPQEPKRSTRGEKVNPKGHKDARFREERDAKDATFRAGQEAQAAARKRRCAPDTHRRPYVGVSQARSWSHFVGIYRQKLTKSFKNDF